MMGWKIFDESVDMIERRHRYFPHLFRWRGQRYQVDAVERCWTVSRRGWKKSVRGHFFQVRAGGGSFELFQDAETGLWQVRRARLEGRRAPARRAAVAWR
jgi:hypothetical protein